MTTRVTLISPATSASLREARFDDGSPLDTRGAAAAASAAGTLRPAGRVLVSPTVRCRETATSLGLAAVQEAALGGLDVGRWRGLTLDEAGADEPGEVLRWLTDPTAAPHGGESVQDLCGRVAQWLDTCAAFDGRILAVVEPEIVRAVVVTVLEAPRAAFWRLDVPPLAATEVTGRSGRWNVRLGRVLGSPGSGAER